MQNLNQPKCFFCIADETCSRAGHEVPLIQYLHNCITVGKFLHPQYIYVCIHNSYCVVAVSPGVKQNKQYDELPRRYQDYNYSIITNSQIVPSQLLESLK